MTTMYRVSCLVNRSWDIATREWIGDTAVGTLIEISTQTSQEEPGNLIPVGVVLLDDNTFQGVPLAFLTYIEE